MTAKTALLKIYEVTGERRGKLIAPNIFITKNERIEITELNP